MKLLDEFREPDRCRTLAAQIKRAATRAWTLMEVCGGQTHGLLRYGIDEALQGAVNLLHGPGCPVCVTPLEAIDLAVQLSGREDVLLTSFGDMLRVPGSRESLLARRARGGNVRIVYSPLDAVQIAAADPQKQVVFFAVGFETTTPATALAVRQAERLGLENFSLLVAHVRVQPAMEMLLESDDCRIEGFLAAGHVCTVTGYESYRTIVEKHRVPVVVTGFEPVDLLSGILECVAQLERGSAEVVNRYQRSVAAQGNPQALEIVDEVYEVCDAPWRGFGVVPRGGLRLREAWSRFDARRRFHFDALPIVEPPECRSGDVLSGRIRPQECEAFAGRCTPDSPLGAPMVSSEGACAAYYRYTNVPRRVAGGSSA
ncbi:MAG: hydrogenase formation protein HypD [Pirellulaceae bacterium]